ncbi:MAG: flagellar hook-basal body protein [candidate division Zixibacteria bacterium]|nr:flagellar hook-basal body protein [candidate division Zixibacteria bacterium]
MIKGIYTSASGMLPNIKRQELTAQNVANAATNGYKKDSLFTRELSHAEQNQKVTSSDWEQPLSEGIYTDYSAGMFDRTGSPLDLAIDGDGFFTLQLEDGSTALTRNGSFKVNKDGLLTTPGGAIVVSEGSAIEVGNGELTVSQSGEIEVDGLVMGKITPMTVGDLQQLEKIGRGVFLAPDDVELMAVDHAVIRQGYLESSNVDIVSEMVDMIIAYRSYEANAKAVKSQDDSLEKLFNRVGSRG